MRFWSMRGKSKMAWAGENLTIFLSEKSSRSKNLGVREEYSTRSAHPGFTSLSQFMLRRHSRLVFSTEYRVLCHTSRMTRFGGAITNLGLALHPKPVLARLIEMHECFSKEWSLSCAKDLSLECQRKAPRERITLGGEGHFHYFQFN